jgi:hypothetical protein
MCTLHSSCPSIFDAEIFELGIKKKNADDFIVAAVQYLNV